MYLRKSGKELQIYFYRTKGFCKLYEKKKMGQCRPHYYFSFVAHMLLIIIQKNVSPMMQVHLTALKQENKH